MIKLKSVATTMLHKLYNSYTFLKEELSVQSKALNSGEFTLYILPCFFYGIVVGLSLQTLLWIMVEGFTPTLMTLVFSVFEMVIYLVCGNALYRAKKGI